jgi:hypothetical protein
MFQSNPLEVAHTVTQHSGGKVSTALEMALKVDIVEQGWIRDNNSDNRNGTLVQQMVQQRAHPIGPTQPAQLQSPPLECPRSSSSSLGNPEDYVLVGFVLVVVMIVPLIFATLIILWRRRRRTSSNTSYHKVGTQGEEEYQDESVSTRTTTLEMSKR